MKNYFDKFPDSYLESSRRRIQTPSAFARSAFFYVQETGYLKLRESHVASRKNLESYLVVLVLSGSGVLMYDGTIYELHKGSCFFIDCMVPYYHQSSETDPCARTALAELHIGIRYERAAVPEVIHGLFPLSGGLAPLQQDRPITCPGQHQAAEQARRAGSHDDRTVFQHLISGLRKMVPLFLCL